MTISPQDAGVALREIENAEARSAMLRGYQHAAPYFLIWGVVWVLGYGLTDFAPPHGNLIWAVLVPVGLVAGYLVSDNRPAADTWRYGATALAFFAFFAATFFVMAPVSGRQVATFIPLVVALMYVLRGIWAGPRHIAAGVVVAALTLVGFVFLHEHFLLWMACVGGGALILAGLWMRRV